MAWQCTRCSGTSQCSPLYQHGKCQKGLYRRGELRLQSELRGDRNNRVAGHAWDARVHHEVDWEKVEVIAEERHYIGREEF